MGVYFYLGGSIPPLHARKVHSEIQRNTLGFLFCFVLRMIFMDVLRMINLYSIYIDYYLKFKFRSTLLRTEINRLIENHNLFNNKITFSWQCGWVKRETFQVDWNQGVSKFIAKSKFKTKVKYSKNYEQYLISLDFQIFLAHVWFGFDIIEFSCFSS